MRPSRLLPIVFALAAALAIPGNASAAAYDAPIMASEVQGHAKIVAIVVAGPSGAPSGFTVQWMKLQDYIANGNQWYAAPNSVQAEASFTGTPTLNTWGGLLSSFSIAPGGVAAVEIGDLFDETGVTTSVASLRELETSTPYVLRARANGDASFDASAWSNTYVIDTSMNLNCTYTLGFWKNHPEQWSSVSLVLGSVNYTHSELLQILQQPAQGNGLVILAHQLIAVELNALQGADTSDVDAAIALAHALIGGLVIPPIGGGYLDPSQTSSVAQDLDDYNNGVTGPGHCDSVAIPPSSWAGTKAAYR